MTVTIPIAISILAVFNPLAMPLSADTYNFFLDEWDCKYTRVTLEKWTVDRSGLVPMLPHVDYMFVHWTADDNEEHWQDIYEVPLTVTECPGCANCWRRHSCPCLRHLRKGDSVIFDKTPSRVIGFDFVTYVNTPCVSPVTTCESVSVEHMPRRSSRVKRQTEFYYF
jgi:hypothetical protein